MNITVYSPSDKPIENEKNQIVAFLYENMGDYGDAESDISNALDYALKERPSFGGFVASVTTNNKIIGAAIINKTGMKGYIPENILVYVATHADYRGKGVGKNLMDTILDVTEGDIALHVEKDNPAIHLYEKYGFTTPYLEMRLRRN